MSLFDAIAAALKVLLKLLEHRHNPEVAYRDAMKALAEDAHEKKLRFWSALADEDANMVADMLARGGDERLAGLVDRLRERREHRGTD
jgi:hypothetical protein